MFWPSRGEAPAWPPLAISTFWAKVSVPPVLTCCAGVAAAAAAGALVALAAGAPDADVGLGAAGWVGAGAGPDDAGPHAARRLKAALAPTRRSTARRVVLWSNGVSLVAIDG